MSRGLYAVIAAPRPAQSTTRHRVIHRGDTVHVWTGTSPHYQSSCVVVKIGDRGFMHSIQGPGYYEHFSKPGTVAQLMRDLEVVSLEGYLFESHERLMRAALRRSANVERLGTGRCDGHDMIWVRVTAI